MLGILGLNHEATLVSCTVLAIVAPSNARLAPTRPTSRSAKDLACPRARRSKDNFLTEPPTQPEGVLKQFREPSQFFVGRVVSVAPRPTSPSLPHATVLWQGGGNSLMELRASTKLDDMHLIDARLIAPGHPERSIMFHRLSHRGFGQMPPHAITTMDEKAVKLFEAWIRSLGEAAP